jgi:hypothetical protein
VTGGIEQGQEDEIDEGDENENPVEEDENSSEGNEDLYEDDEDL